MRELARVKGVGLTEAVKAAAEAELQREREKVPLRERIRPIQDEIASWGRTGLLADKAFFDSLNDEVMFVDASALVAILLRKPEADAFADRIEASPAPLTSAIAI